MVPTQRAISQLPASATRSARSSSRYDRTRSRAVSITTPDDPVAAPATSSFDRFAKAPSPHPATLAQEALAPRLGLTLDADRGQRTLHAMTCRSEAGYPKLSSPVWVAIIVTQRYNQVTFSNHNIHFICLGILPLPRRWTLPPNVQLRGSKGRVGDI